MVLVFGLFLFQSSTRPALHIKNGQSWEEATAAYKSIFSCSGLDFIQDVYYRPETSPESMQAQQDTTFVSAFYRFESSNHDPSVYLDRLGQSMCSYGYTGANLYLYVDKQDLCDTFQGWYQSGWALHANGGEGFVAAGARHFKCVVKAWEDLAVKPAEMVDERVCNKYMFGRVWLSKPALVAEASRDSEWPATKFYTWYDAGGGHFFQWMNTEYGKGRIGSEDASPDKVYFRSYTLETRQLNTNPCTKSGTLIKAYVFGGALDAVRAYGDAFQEFTRLTMPLEGEDLSPWKVRTALFKNPTDATAAPDEHVGVYRNEQTNQWSCFCPTEENVMNSFWKSSAYGHLVDADLDQAGRPVTHSSDAPVSPADLDDFGLLQFVDSE